MWCGNKDDTEVSIGRFEPQHSQHNFRQDRNNQPVKGWYAHEALTIEQAFKGFTLDAAYAGHMEDTLGTLTPGKWADFILVDQDIFTIDAKDIWKTEVHATYVAGEEVFSKWVAKTKAC